MPFLLFAVAIGILTGPRNSLIGDTENILPPFTVTFGCRNY